MTQISVIVPALNEAATITGTLARLREPEVLEVVVVDGRSEDGTAAIARPLVDRVIEASAGRARQMNAGAGVARGDVLFFLHADTAPPRGFAAAIVAACDDAIGGRFDVELDAPGLAYRVIEAAINLRSRWSGLFTGDQGLFVRRDVFESLGGYPDLPLLEDLALARAMKKRGRTAALRMRLRTSARRWQRHGVLRTVALMWWIRALYFLGVAPERLARLYPRAR
ncbi:MAG: TIGR04283 family arsenosugar biosynthesis glycosyltransferase [Candidatus Binatia bacterium]